MSTPVAALVPFASLRPQSDFWVYIGITASLKSAPSMVAASATVGGGSRSVNLWAMGWAMGYGLCEDQGSPVRDARRVLTAVAFPAARQAGMRVSVNVLFPAELFIPKVLIQVGA